MFYDDKGAVIQEERLEVKPISNIGLLLVIALLGASMALLASIYYSDSNLVELSATALRTCAGCAGK